jgi:RsiW-degrading membrane proteinase PrsW (M82 family)
MSKNSLPSSRKHYFIFMMIELSIILPALGVFLLIPQNYRLYYALLAAIIFMAGILLMPLLKPLSEEEKRVRPFLVLFGSLIISGVFLLFFLDVPPENTQPWLMTIVFLSGFMSSGVLFQYLGNRKIIL